MFGELPKLIDRNYVVGFLLPAAILCLLWWWMAGSFGLAPRPDIATIDKVIGATAVIASLWLVSILLIALNYSAYRLLEGYGLKRFRPALRVSAWRFERMAKPSLDQQAQVERARSAGEPLPARPEDHADKLRKAVEGYPDESRWVLPGPFGNRMRAAEVYARVVYGLDSVPIWPRLQALLPGDFRDLLNSAKAQLDFCVNVAAAGILAGLTYAALCLYLQHFPAWLPLGVSLATIAIGYLLAVQSAKPYGLYVRAAFDLYRGPLAEQLGLSIPPSPAEEREMWKLVSRMIIYRSSARFDDLAPYRKRHEKAASPTKIEASVVTWQRGAPRRGG